MIVIMYEILFAYMDDVKKAHEQGDRTEMKTAIRNSTRALDELIKSLDFSYELSHNLFALYVFCKNQLARTMYENRMDGLLEADKVLKRLYHSFVEVAKQDTSAPMMRNTQQVYAGMTYTRGVLNESYMEMDDQRGFFV
jgi:flagellar protein FliS